MERNESDCFRQGFAFNHSVANPEGISSAVPHEMKTRILLIGRNGQVGTELALLLPRLGELIALSRQELDLTKPTDIRRTIQEVRPQWIFSAAAYTAVDQAESDESTARAVNE